MKKYKICDECHQEYLQVTSIQRFCNPKCRMKNWDRMNPRINRIKQMELPLEGLPLNWNSKEENK